MERMFDACLVHMSLAFTLAVPLCAQFESTAVIRYSAGKVNLSFVPAAMNNRGWIVGWDLHPMRYRPGVGNEQISNLEGSLKDINDAGVSVGGLAVERRNEAITRPPGAPWQRLGTLDGSGSIATSINESGQIVGYFIDTSGQPRPFLYTEAEGMRILFDASDAPIGINEAGQVLTYRYLWDPVKGPADMSAAPGGNSFRAVALADNGIVAGYSEVSSPTGTRRQLTTFSWEAGLSPIGAVYRYVNPTATNDRGWIVGAFGNSTSAYRAFLYVRGQGIRDLDSLLVAPLGSPLLNALDINDRDEILAVTEAAEYYVLKRVRE